MKQFIKAFLFRGLMAAWGGPVILAIIYGILGASGEVQSLSPSAVCTGILTVTLLAFFVAGMNAVFTVERLPLALAITIHGGALYLCYILIYLVNGWLKQQLVPILIFTGIFLVGYAIIWLVIYIFTKRKTDQLNRKLQKELRNC